MNRNSNHIHKYNTWDNREELISSRCLPLPLLFVRKNNNMTLSYWPQTIVPKLGAWHGSSLLSERD